MPCPNEFRIAVILADIEGLSYEEIAETHELLARNRALAPAPGPQTAAPEGDERPAAMIPIVFEFDFLALIPAY